MNIGKGVVNFFKNVFKGDMSGALDALKGIFGSFVDSIKGRFEAILGFLRDTLGGGVIRILTGVGKAVLNFFRDTANTIIGWVDSIIKVANKVPFVNIKFDAEKARGGVNSAFDSMTGKMDDWADGFAPARVKITEEMKKNRQ